MESEIWEIVLAGGPASGKTSALARLPERLAEHDLQALVAPEIATFLITGGLPLAHLGRHEQNRGKFLAVEEQILLMQRSFREYYLALARILGGRVAILYDRGEMDHCLYMGRKAFEKALRKHDLTHFDVRDSYAKVVHMVSTAVDAPKFYTTQNNPARSDTPEEAAQLDALGLEAWTGANLVVIDNSTDFEGKLARVEQAVLQACGIMAPLSVQHKFLLEEAPDADKSPLSGAQVFEITQTYLRTESPEVERSVRMVRHQDQESWMYRTKRPAGVDLSTREKVEARISQSEYRRLLGDADPEKLPVHKRRHVFVHRHLVCKVDAFTHPDIWMLEVDWPTDGREYSFRAPAQLKIAREVTDDPAFRTHALADKSSRQVKP